MPLDAHGCPACPHPAIGPAIAGSPTVLVNKRPALRVDDPGIHAPCCGTNTWAAIEGSASVFINGKAAHRMGDDNRHCGGTGQLIEGSPNVIVGDASAGGGGGAGGQAGGAASGSSRRDHGTGGTAGGPPGGIGSPGGDEDGGGNEQGPSGDTPAGIEQPAQVEEDEIVVVVVNVDGTPQVNVEYELTFPDGSSTAGKTLPDGSIRRSGLTQRGACPLDFPDVLVAEPAPANASGRQRFVRDETRVPIGAHTVVELPPLIWRGRLRGMLFETDKTFLLPSAMRSIRNLRLFYEDFSDLRVLIVGHADRQGDAAYNEHLSEERARAIAAFLTDAVDAWMRHYQGTPHSARWGTREDQHMLSALGYYAGAITDTPTAESSAALAAYQGEHGLAATGTANEATRRALVTEYMGQDGTSLPPGTPIVTHGCGENHPEVATADGAAEQRNRRVEMFLFEGPVEPPPRTPCSTCPEYPIWLERTVLTVDLDQDPAFLTVQVIDAKGTPVANAEVHAGGPTPKDGVTDSLGMAELGEVLPGTYKVIATKNGHAAHRTVTVEPGVALAPSASPAPGALALIDSAEVAPPTSAVPPATGSSVVQIQLLAAAPIITKLEGAARPDPQSPLSSPSSFVYFGQGELVHVFWEIQGEADKLVLQPGDLDVTDTTSAVVDPSTSPPNADGKYVLHASFQGVEAAPAELKAAGILELRMLPSDNPFLSPPSKLFDHDGKVEVPEIRGRAGSYHRAPHNTGQTWFGQATVRSELTLAWRAAGAQHIRIEADIEHARTSPAGATPVVTGRLREDVTARTRAADPITGAVGEGRLSFEDAAPILCRVDLAITREGGGALGSSVLLVREHIPHPGIVDFAVLDKSARIAPGSTVSAWANVAFAWTLSGDYAQCRVVLQLHDEHGTLLGASTLDPAAERTGFTVTIAPAPVGRVRARLELRNLAGQLAGPAKQLEFVVLATPPALHKLTVMVFSKPSGPAVGAKVTAIDKTGVNHVGTADAAGNVTFPNVADGDVTIIAERPPSNKVIRSVVLTADQTVTMSLDDPTPAAFEVKVAPGEKRVLRPLIVADDAFGTSKVSFKIEIIERDGPAAPSFVEIKVMSAGGATIFSERHESGPLVLAGEHDWEWNGYSTAGVLDTALLKQTGLKVQVTVGAPGAKDSLGTLVLDNKGDELDWIDLLVDPGAHRIDVHVFFRPQRPKLNGVEIADFSMLITRIEEGIRHHWSRTITIGGMGWTVAADATIRPSSPTMDIVLRKGIDLGPLDRSCNPSVFIGESFVVFAYNPPPAGASVAEVDWRIADDRHTGAHEIGHTIVEKGSGSFVSARHKGTSTALGTMTTKAIYPATGENDLMKYYKYDRAWTYVDRRHALSRAKLVEEDVKTLLDFARVEFDD
ncbi:MAG TPA: carboxypeptidase regulatory-like domain-containing protein [Kofleriaceae bacterium]|nr:carboxypeptidase regulatory-like domain-containing protein [Kofleriaceae bacterium]